MPPSCLPRAFRQQLRVTLRTVSLSPLSLGPGRVSVSPAVGLWQSGRCSLLHSHRGTQGGCSSEATAPYLVPTLTLELLSPLYA